MDESWRSRLNSAFGRYLYLELIAVPQIFTIGHSTRTLAELLRLLRSAGVNQLVDVRTIPRSRHNPQFNRETLGPFLRGKRINYRHIPDLGGLRRTTVDSPNKAWRNASFRGYADYMQTAGFKAGLNKLLKLAKPKTVAIMCAEAVPWRCHRSLIADALTVRGFAVLDIISEAKPKEHVLNPMARVYRNRITYPPAIPRFSG
jgi:uncharacterized protein (DUF488 family)